MSKLITIQMPHKTILRHSGILPFGSALELNHGINIEKFDLTNSKTITLRTESDITLATLKFPEFISLDNPVAVVDASEFKSTILSASQICNFIDELIKRVPRICHIILLFPYDANPPARLYFQSDAIYVYTFDFVINIKGVDRITHYHPLTLMERVDYSWNALMAFLERNRNLIKQMSVYSGFCPTGQITRTLDEVTAAINDQAGDDIRVFVEFVPTVPCQNNIYCLSAGNYEVATLLSGSYHDSQCFYQ